MKKILRIAASITAALIILATILYQTGTFRSGMIAPGEKTAPPEPAKDYKLFRLTQTEVPVIYRTVGTIRSRDEIELSPRITARIVNITRRSGDSVKKDEPLVELDNSDLKAAEQQAAEQLNVTEAALLLAERNYRRQKLLLERNVIPRKTFEEAEETLQAAHAREKAARQALLQTKANLSYATIQSPMDGIISDRLDDPGDLASPGNIILKVFDPTRLMLYVPLRESLVSAVKIHDKIRFHVESLNRLLTGEVKEIVPAVDPGSRTFLIKMCILGDTQGLMPGMFGTLELQLGTEKAYLVPESAVTRIGQLEYLKVMQDGTVSKVPVRTVPAPEPGRLRVVSGIDSDAEIVLKTQE